MPLLRDSSDERAREGVGRRECCRSVRAADRLNRRSPRVEAHCHGRMLSIDRRWSVGSSRIDRSFRRLFAIRLEAVAAGDRQRPMMMMLLLLLLLSTNDRSVRETTTTTTTRRKLSTSADRPRARRGGAARRAGSATRAAARTARARPRSPRAARSARPSGATRLSR